MEKLEIIDSHCHIDVAAFDADRQQVLENCRAAGVSKMIVPGIAVSGWDKLLNICAQEKGLYPALGLHPVFLEQHGDADIERLEQAVAAVQLVAVGEIGLDYYVAGLDPVRQQALFEAQLCIARDAGLPVILHVRKAHDQVLATLKRIKVKGGIAHAFNGSLQQAQQYAGLGFKLGFGGMMSYAHSKRLRQLAGELPLDWLVLETDSPDMAGEGHRGERNSPEYLPEYLASLAFVRGGEASVIAEQTTNNVRQVFKFV